MMVEKKMKWNDHVTCHLRLKSPVLDENCIRTHKSHHGQASEVAYLSPATILWQ